MKEYVIIGLLVGTQLLPGSNIQVLHENMETTNTIYQSVCSVEQDMPIALEETAPEEEDDTEMNTVISIYDMPWPEARRTHRREFRDLVRRYNEAVVRPTGV